jgi:hypothetical protein
MAEWVFELAIAVALNISAISIVDLRASLDGLIR